MTQITIKEAAKLLGITRERFISLVSQGVFVEELGIKVYFSKNGKKMFLIYKECIENYIKKCKGEN